MRVVPFFFFFFAVSLSSPLFSIRVFEVDLPSCA